MNLEYVPPETLRQWWPTIKPGLSECIKHDTDGPILEDIYWVLKTAQATLHVGLDENGKYLGFMVLNQAVNPFSGTKRLHIWFLHNVEPEVNVLIEGMAQLEELAENAGIKDLTFRADKLAFERWGAKLGFTLREIELHKGL